MLKQSIGMGLLCIAGQAFSADIIITTTLDNDVDDKECSLREAIHYVNTGMPKEGYKGCGGENSTTSILLKEKEIYNIKSQLVLNKSATIKTTYETNVTQTVNKGLLNAIIKMDGKDRILKIEKALDADSKDLPVVRLEELTLEGCGTNSCQVDQGGLIFNYANLSLDYVKLTSGYANQGGAIFTAGVEGDIALATVKNTLIEGNTAQQGGAVYSVFPSLRMTQSVVRKNTTHHTASANLYTEQALLNTAQGHIYNSSLYANNGAVLNIIDGVAVNNATIVANKGTGIVFAAQDKFGIVANSIILANSDGGSDSNCTFATSVTNENKRLQNNLVTASCGSGEADYENQILPLEFNPIAGNDIEGKCPNITESPKAILCPYKASEKSFLGYFRPRIPLDYQNISESPIINTGKAAVSEHALFCMGSDQREQSRPSTSPANISCDRGAIEIVVPRSSSLVGQDLKVGEIAKFSILDALGDSDLVPKSECNRIVGAAPQGEVWQDGCITIKQQSHISSKGKLTIDLDGNVVYTPNSAWHGEDSFTLRVITTTSRFEESDPYLDVRVNIVQEPDNTMVSDKIKTSGGSTGLGWLVILLGLGMLRRLK